jgi:hypothetical protein
MPTCDVVEQARPKRRYHRKAKPDDLRKRAQLAATFRASAPDSAVATHWHGGLASPPARITKESRLQVQRRKRKRITAARQLHKRPEGQTSAGAWTSSATA